MQYITYTTTQGSTPSYCVVGRMGTLAQDLRLFEAGTSWVGISAACLGFGAGDSIGSTSAMTSTYVGRCNGSLASAVATTALTARESWTRPKLPKSWKWWVWGISNNESLSCSLPLGMLPPSPISHKSVSRKACHKLQLLNQAIDAKFRGAGSGSQIVIVGGLSPNELVK